MENKKDKIENTLIVGESKTFEKVHIPMALYPAVIIAIDNVSDGEFGKRIAIRFEFMHNGKGVQLSRLFYAKLTNKTALGKTFKTITNKELTPGESVDINFLIGQKAILLVKDFTNSNNEIFSVIDTILPFIKQ